MTTVLSHAEPVARKPHVCDECFTTIRAGERYVRQGNVLEGRKYTYTAHYDCYDRVVELDDGTPWSEQGALIGFDPDWVAEHHPKEEG